ncbi:uncharacterized protein LOC129590168 [Paramacrobiotus metropolitanus]|uniref:uncharacterized protein LOC129590168 n=1 Tax=Paramacrobiotus metropolitanus TaxID=2943436 RepID=UPI002446186B|nr:uncharacterized protein LOC129590168 [Paramacrobiotus metropolitanus]
MLPQDIKFPHSKSAGLVDLRPFSELFGFAASPPQEIFYDFSVLDEPISTRLEATDAPDATDVRQTVSLENDKAGSSDADNFSNILALSKKWVVSSDTSYEWTEKLRSCFLPDSNHLVSSVTHKVLDTRSEILNEFTPVSLHTAPYQPSFESVFKALQGSNHALSDLVENTGNCAREEDAIALQREVKTIVSDLIDSKEKSNAGAAVKCAESTVIPKHASCRFWSKEKGDDRKNSYPAQTVKCVGMGGVEGGTESTPSAYDELSNCHCAIAQTDDDPEPKQYDIWQEVAPGSSKRAQNIPRFHPPVPSPLPYCYNPSQIFVQSRLKESTLFSVCSENLQITPTDGGWIHLRLRLPEETPIFGVPPGQFVVLTACIKCGCKSQLSEVGGLAGTFRISRPVFPVSGCDALGFVDFLWLNRCSIKQRSDVIVCQDRFGFCLEHFASHDSLSVDGPFGSILYRGLGWFSFMQEPTKEIVTKSYRNVIMIGMTFGMLPLLSVLEHAAREMAVPTTFTCVQLHINSEPCWIGEKLSALSKQRDDLTYMEYNINFSLDWELDTFQKDLFSKIPPPPPVLIRL